MVQKCLLFVLGKTRFGTFWYLMFLGHLSNGSAAPIAPCCTKLISFAILALTCKTCVKCNTTFIIFPQPSIARKSSYVSSNDTNIGPGSRNYLTIQRVQTLFMHSLSAESLFVGGGAPVNRHGWWWCRQWKEEH